MILRMIDGGIVDIDVDIDRIQGTCGTCDYGSHTVMEIEIDLTKYHLKVKFDDDGYCFTEAELMVMLLRNAEYLMNHCESFFCQWFKNKVNGKYKEFKMGAKKEVYQG